MAVGAGAAIIMLLLFVVLGMEDSIDMNQYLTIEAEGYDGYGKLHAAINWDAVEEKYGEKLSFTEEAGKTFGGLISLMSPIDTLFRTVLEWSWKHTAVYQTEIVPTPWKVDEDLANMLKCKIKCRRRFVFCIRSAAGRNI